MYNVEQDYSLQVPNLATTVGAFAGVFAWGPCFEPHPVTSQKDLATKYGPPQNWNFETWYTAYNYLEYTNNFYVVRTANTTSATGSNLALCAVCGNTPAPADILGSVVLNKPLFLTQLAKTGGFPANVFYVAKWPSGTYGNSLEVSQCCSNTQYNAQILLTGNVMIANVPAIGVNTLYTAALVLVPGSNSATITWTANAGGNIVYGNTYANSLMQSFSTTDYWLANTGIRGNPTQLLQVANIGAAVTNSSVTTVAVTFNNTFAGAANTNATSVNRYWQFFRSVQPSNPQWISPYQQQSNNPSVADLMQIVVVDKLGAISGVPNTILNVYQNVSRATNAVNPDGSTNYYRNVINYQDKYIWNVNDVPGALSNTAATLVAVTQGSVPFYGIFAGGADGETEANVSMQTLINGWILFQGTESILIDLIPCGKPLFYSATAGLNNATYSNYGMASWIIQNIVQRRKDCMCFFSPDPATVINNVGNENIDVPNWASLVPSSTYACMDSGYKQQEDAVNNVYRWIPLNGDIAGLCAYNDQVSYPWTSPAGFNRGQISNVVKLAWNPQEPDRDIIYPLAINPVVSFPSQGTYLYGDKTFTTMPTGFSRINVRRTFLFIERAIKAAAQYTLFENNNTFTQNQFLNLVNPYLKGIKGSNGIQDFLVVCGPSINTPTVIDADEFLCAIYIKPEHSINFIQIVYINTPTGVDFSTLENVSLSSI